MRLLGAWVSGFGRSCAVAAVCLAVPGVWAAAVAWGIWWGATNPWSWSAPVLLVVAGTIGLARPVCQAARRLVARWSGTTIPGGYRRAVPVTRLSTGYWWNGFSYERTRRDALMDQRWRLRWRDPANLRDLRFVAVAPLTAGLVAALPPGGLAVAVLGSASAQTSVRVAGAVGALVLLAAAPWAWRLLEPVAVRFLRPSPAMALADRVEELTVQRADVTVAQAAEIRRIERDLHDGAQARLVALGLSLATAQRLMDRDPEAARALMREAQAGATASLAELRELIRGISPPVLSERGLLDAVRALALDSPLEVSVRAEGALELDAPIESALYFAVAELLTNAAKHARATHARITIRRDATALRVEVEDDGRGGAAVRSGGGLDGLRRRLAVFDGTMEVTSPPGGPTVAIMMVPCESW
ncbi:signal transduction histidine kinase [Streptacidiphilus sp. MAP12-33]|uniref:sensor histidine kinase n=1 Tax=Streptacidiphilus sp. MAP12-33 TaxID=3156266 RepID=UPI003512C505